MSSHPPNYTGSSPDATLGHLVNLAGMPDMFGGNKYEVTFYPYFVRVSDTPVTDDDFPSTLDDFLEKVKVLHVGSCVTGIIEDSVSDVQTVTNDRTLELVGAFDGTSTHMAIAITTNISLFGREVTEPQKQHIVWMGEANVAFKAWDRVLLRAGSITIGLPLDSGVYGKKSHAS